MVKCAEFEKVSYEQFEKDMLVLLGSATIDGGVLYDELIDMIKGMYEDIELPKRATVGSAGYDIRTPIGFDLNVKEEIKIPTGLRVKIDEGWFLGCLPRSGLGFKYKMQLANTMGVIDSDYYNSSNEGHIMLKICNDNNEGKMISVEAGDKLVQGILFPYGITYNDNVNVARDGGFGSTGRK